MLLNKILRIYSIKNASYKYYTKTNRHMKILDMNLKTMCLVYNNNNMNLFS